ncbi:MAG: hypothetical protein AB7O37_11515 [Vicinamibacteria bacterium]
MAELLEDRFFDDAFLSELEEIAGHEGPLEEAHADGALHLRLQEFLSLPGAGRLDEEGFVELAAAPLTERTNALLEVCRAGRTLPAVQAVENFVVFFQALVPTLDALGARQVKRFFFRLVPTLLQIAAHDFGDSREAVAEGRAALHNLETILIEVSDVRFAPSESELVFRSIDQLAAFIAAGEYAMASRIVSAQLLELIEKNKLARALYRLMEVEVQLQRYLKERLGYATPRLALPEDAAALSDYGPLRVLDEESQGGETTRMIQIHVPGIPNIADVVLHLVGEGGRFHDLRLDALGSAELRVPAGAYALGLTYEPPGRVRRS